MKDRYKILVYSKLTWKQDRTLVIENIITKINNSDEDNVNSKS